MVDVVGVIRTALVVRIREIERGARLLPDGRGSQLRSLLIHAVDTFNSAVAKHDAELISVAESGATDDVRLRLRLVVAQKLERMQTQIEITYQLLNTFRNSVGRTDVPIGLQHLLSVVLDEIVAQPADPLVHLNPARMYSTRDLVDLVDEAFMKHRAPRLSDTYDGPHPIVFNLPALDPSNALLSPIIAHEVAHTAVEESLRAELKSRVDTRVRSLLKQHLIANGIPEVGKLADEWAARFRDWCGELICDAVALVAAGPAFALAFASFAPPGATPTVGTHPPIRDRIAFHLNILEDLGWGPTLRERLPSVDSWLREVSSEPMLSGIPAEAFLREAMTLVADDIADIAKRHVRLPLDPEETEAILDDLVRSISDGVPNVETQESAAEPWQVILAGWIAAVDTSHPAGEQLVEVVSNRGLSELLIKGLELSSIVRSWRKHERTSS